ncbi:MAG: bifunctional diaminohydroxyphosphoribosylaminopyrimidine deaminase/5-amino-6-(5-phosphoribosylamino)uracil reductase RibD [Bacteroidetes bacterium]|nr:bifunctional diaminohydroxyphosphoribosylaminopyrimidine deaminase/5-amino-6-(5-phosphoribosylamino)uracil reductase RibD [Bacteroidota bacterium]MBS1741243.1 bifunctional diaminohydroxyphosphoribosylaminopyrimidine deaminase/5-amino-6-(5-phosphoribosylamino)uracil reductase RibD [Bacteroidota bacterium]MBS1775027.1 bifunctional diaminohydroxyphosphoribosylaminopyrimidine deaminase/5-amino-6-(5-phosphoribosylamino)uracil reductase RibD [Bacteroidota bacterium]
MQHDTYIRRCLDLAEKGSGYTAPNPLVGAVLVYDNRIIGEGYHAHYGERHAEVACFENVASSDKIFIPESTLYVSLEPCAHQGKTPPCADRIVQEGIKNVVVCQADPFAAVNGRGFEILRSNGVTVTENILAEEGRWQNRRFLCFHEKKRPYITLKWAETTQGFFAPLNRSRWQISNKQTQQLTHKWRTEESAIMVGTRTALHDNPQLNARYWNGKQPLRIVLDRALTLPESHHLLDGSIPTWIINERKEKVLDKTQYIQLSFDENLLTALLSLLYQKNILSLLVEGGAQLIQSLIDAALWDEARIFSAPSELQEGIVAPSLRQSIEIANHQIGNNSLNIFCHSQNSYNIPHSTRNKNK